MHLSKECRCSWAGADHARQANAGNLPLAAAQRNLAHALAHQRGAIDGPFRGNHQVRCAQMPIQRRLPGKQLKPRLQFRTQKCHQPKAQPTRGAGPRLPRDVASELLLKHACQPAQATFGQRKVLSAQTFLRPIHPSRAPLAEQAVPHICCHHNAVKPPAALRDADSLQLA